LISIGFEELLVIFIDIPSILLEKKDRSNTVTGIVAPNLGYECKKINVT